MSSVQKCKLNHNEFCFVCGSWFLNEKNRSILLPTFMKAYKDQFNRDVNDRNVQCSPNVYCSNCYRCLRDKDRKIKYSVPVIWNEPKNHPFDCYFCNTTVPGGLNKNKRNLIKYPDPRTVSILNARICENFDDEGINQGDNESQSDDEMQTAASMDVDDEENVFVQPTPMQTTTTSAEGTSAGTELEGNVSPPIVTSEFAIAFDSFIPPDPVTSSNFAFDINAIVPSDLDDVQSGLSVPSGVSIPSTSSVSSHERWQAPRHHADVQPKRPKIVSPRLTQAMLNDLVRDLGLSKTKSEMLASRLVQLLKEFTPEVEKGSYFRGNECKHRFSFVANFEIFYFV